MPKVKKSNGIYLTYLVYSEYGIDTGLRGSRTAGPEGSPCSIVRMDGGIMTLKIVYSMTRLGLPCEPPAAESNDPNVVFIKSTPGVVVPNLMPDGATFIYGSAGVHEYILRKPLPKDSKIKIGVPVYIQTEPPNNTTRLRGEDPRAFK